MRPRFALFSFAIACGCVPSNSSPAVPLPNAAPSSGPVPSSTPPVAATPPVAPAELPDEARWRERWKDCPPGQALDEAQSRELDYFHESPFSVIRVSPSDTLNLRASSSPDAESLAKLDFQQAGLRWTGSACNVAGTLWFEIESKGRRGWVNGFYARPTTSSRDETERVKPWSTAAKSAGFPQFVEQLRRAVARHEAAAETGGAPPCDVQLVGSVLEGSRARIVLYVECGANDSIAGSQLLVTATSGAAGWTIANVDWRDVCLRGAEDYCI